MTHPIARSPRRLALGLVLLVLLALLAPGARAQTPEAPAEEGPPEIEFLTPYGPPTRPFSPAVRVGHLLFLSGQIGTRADAGGGLVPGGIEAETRQTLENIRDVLERSGSSLDRVVKCTVMLADMAEWERMNAVYATFFPRHKPARSALGASGLALGARVEIECIAVVGPGR
ncbi:MAG TPA: RidA family protein [Gemmatimonadales bacterium]|nr:RidA family protein [Gemmatimonadales bacterium]